MTLTAAIRITSQVIQIRSPKTIHRSWKRSRTLQSRLTMPKRWQCTGTRLGLRWLVLTTRIKRRRVLNSSFHIIQHIKCLSKRRTSSIDLIMEASSIKTPTVSSSIWTRHSLLNDWSLGILTILISTVRMAECKMRVKHWTAAKSNLIGEDSRTRWWLLTTKLTTASELRMCSLVS